MIDIKLNSEGDLYFEKGQLVLFEKEEEFTVQQLAIQLKTYLGEWFLNNTLGVPYFQVITQKGNNKVLIDSIFRSKIIANENIVSITRFNSTIINSEYSLDFTAITTSGEIISVQQDIEL